MKRFKIILAALMAVSMVQVFPGFVNAENNSAAENSIKTSSYSSTTVDIHIEARRGDDITQKVQQALDLARDLATDSMPYKIIIPRGTYKITAPLEIYSNTQIYAVGSHIIKEHLSGGLLRTAIPKGGKQLKGYTGYRNIKIEGGIWDGNSESEKFGEGKCNVFSSFRFAHATNITLKDLSVTNNVGSHHVEFGGIDGITVTGCTFEGYKNGGVSGGKEAIQLDIMSSADVFVGFPSFDDTPCKNVKISNNKFINVNRGVGSHTAVNGIYFDNIEITDNLFEDITQQAILALNWHNCTISSNCMRNVGSGVDFKSMEPSLYNNPKLGEAVVDSESKTTITNNSISVRFNADNDLPYVFGIRAWGADVNSSNNPNKIATGRYPVEGINVCNNKITSYGKINAGISGKLMNNSTIYGNIIDFSQSDSNDNSRGIYLNQSNNNTIEKNICQQIIGTGGNGIHLVGSDKNTIKTNTVTECSGSGISLNSYSNNNEVIGGTILQNSSNGISINSSNKNTVKSVKDIDDNGNYGIAVCSSSSSNTITNVAIESSGKSGIAFTGSSTSNTLTKAVSENNDGSGMTISSSANNKITSSSFSSNKSYGITITGNSSSNNAQSCNSDNNSKGQIAISSDSNGNTVDAFKTATVEMGITPSVPQNVKMASRSSTKIKLQWSKSKNASGYYIYRKNSDGIYKKIKTVEGGSTLNFTDTNLSPNKSYSYRVTAYYKSNNNVVNSTYAKTITASTLLKATSTLTGTATKNSVTLKWSKVSGATGYYVYRYNTRTKEYEKFATINSSNTLTIKNTGLSANTKYTYKITAFKKTSSGTLGGDTSKAFSIVTKK